MKKILTYKGITLEENNFGGYLCGEGKYKVECGSKKFPFKSITEFKNAVNGKSIYPKDVPVSVPYLENGAWGYVPIEDFQNFVKKNLEIRK